MIICCSALHKLFLLFISLSYSHYPTALVLWGSLVVSGQDFLVGTCKSALDQIGLDKTAYLVTSHKGCLVHALDI